MNNTIRFCVVRIETFMAGKHKNVYFSTYVPMKHTVGLDCIQVRLATNIVLERVDRVHFW